MQTTKLTRTGLFLVLLIICSQLSIPIPLIPLTLQTLAVGVIASVLSVSEGLLIISSYLLMGLVGLPVFANFTGGISIFFSPLGGYLMGFFFYILITKLVLHFTSTNIYSLMLANLAGAAIQLLVGTIWIMFYANISLSQGVMIGFVPFIIPGLVKIYLVVIISQRLLNLSLLKS
ncbi:MAG: Biotin transporter [Lactobacillus helveticus]|jgi:biotin transport system substrate-specific component|nr:biotin transporter BioY [Lactobacillus helveticus]MBN6048403.1 biotin transporter BioY [Lactobacillus helveticus]MCT0165156.1 biotin transporter BioY [Lactobacillus helveticus]MCT0193433.1 biotin transporter BioY [Lactobacillus helveticus]MCT0198015.1 biotin transporter BioY [Lactobacillus helveticus]